MKTNLIHYLFSVHSVNQPLHVSGIFVANLANRQSTKKAQHVPIVVYIQYTSWWWATNNPETCRCWL